MTHRTEYVETQRRRGRLNQRAKTMATPTATELLKAEIDRLQAENEKLKAKKDVRAGRTPLITKQWIAEYIATQPREKVEAMVGRALVRLWERQTLDEREYRSTAHTNAMGFRAGGDDRNGSDAAETFIRTGHLTEEQLAAWTRLDAKGRWPRIAAYDRQLNEVAWALEDARAAK